MALYALGREIPENIKKIMIKGIAYSIENIIAIRSETQDVIKLKRLAIELAGCLWDYRAIKTLCGQNFYSNLMNMIDVWKPSGQKEIVLKMLRLLILIGWDQGSGMLQDAIGMHGKMWLNKMEGSFEEFTVANLVQGVRDMLENGQGRSHEERLLMLDWEEIKRFWEASLNPENNSEVHLSSNPS